jgi:5'-methylthioinosine phosphorylase
MTVVAVIGGSGLAKLASLTITRREVVRTPYGEPSAPIVYGTIGDDEIAFLPRHGPKHTIPPHEVNYRANLWALKQAGIERVIAIAAVGGVSEGYREPCTLVIPDQIIDYTYGREHTFFKGQDGMVTHVDFTYPYCEELRQSLITAAASASMEVIDGGTYGAKQGPRFETAAEVRRLERDGVDVVGMSGMPEAALARELDMCYATIALVVNPAAGKGERGISIAEIDDNLRKGIRKVRKLIEACVPLITGLRTE